MANISKINFKGVEYNIKPLMDSVPTQGSTNAVSSGGVYSALDTLQAQIPQIDPTLSQSGQAADAKKTGDEITNLKEDLNNTLSLNSDGAVVVPKQANFDTYLTPGNYKVTTVAIAETISNIPYETSGRLVVMSSSQSDRIMQFYIANSTVDVYVWYRFYNGAFSSWFKIATKKEINPLEISSVVNSRINAYPYSNNRISYSVEGTTIKFTPGRILCHYNGPAGNTYEKIVNLTSELSVPHDSFAILNIDSSAIEVKTLAEMKSLQGVNYAILFYNSNGTIRGDFELYNLSNKLFANADLYFYGTRYPIFKTGADYSIEVSIPSFTRGNSVDINATMSTFKNGVVTNVQEQTITVPHDKCLVYDASTKMVSVENARFGYSSEKTILFYNSHGIPNGTWYRYYLLQLIREANDGYPNYFAAHIDSKAKQINLQLANLSYGDAFIFITDVHYNKNQMHSPGLVGNICKKTGITTIHLNGDQITKESDKQTALLEINRINNAYKYVGCDTFFTVGNHEWNNPSASDTEEALAAQVNEEEMRFAFVNPMKKTATFAKNSISYYYDNEISKTRYLVGEVRRGSSIILDSVQWIAEKIAEAPAGYGIVVIMHTILTFTKSGTTITPAIQNSTGATFLTNIMDAVRNNGTYTYNGVTYDYSNKNLEMICALCGDTHVDLFMRTPGGVPIICTTTDSTDEEGNLDRATGTINEQAFDAVVINRTEKMIYCNRIGAGGDRTYPFSE